MMINSFFYNFKTKEKRKNLVEVIYKKYSFQEKIGDGSFSSVYRAVEKKTKKEYAIKIIKKNNLQFKKHLIDNEIDILSKLDHPNIIKLKEIFNTKKKFFIVMEYAKGGELFDKLREKDHFTEREASKIIKKILLALQHLHKQGVVHRDLKPENLLLSDSSQDAELKISDFGLSKMISKQDIMSTACGTPYYVAPEVLSHQGYGKEVDLWSTGVIMYVLLSGCAPFYDERIPILFKKIKTGSVNFPKKEWGDISKEAIDLIRHFLIVSVPLRITIKEALNHPWIIGKGNVKTKIPQKISSQTKKNQKQISWDWFEEII